MSILGHVPEKDGLLAGLLAAEMVAARGRSIAQLRDDLFAKVGPLYSAREDFMVTSDQTARLKDQMKSPPHALGTRTVARATVLDGLRLDFEDGSWLLMRFLRLRHIIVLHQFRLLGFMLLVILMLSPGPARAVFYVPLAATVRACLGLFGLLPPGTR